LPLALKTLRFKTPDLSPDVVKRDPPHQQIVRKRSMAALALGAIADPSALPHLRETIMTDDHAVRVAAAQAVIQIVDHATPAGPEAQASALPAAR